MDISVTAGAWRALQLAERVAQAVAASQVEPVHLLWALWLEESRAAEILAACGVPRGALETLCPLPQAFFEQPSHEFVATSTPQADSERSPPQRPHFDDYQVAATAGGVTVAAIARRFLGLHGIFEEAKQQMSALGAGWEIGSEHLLWGLSAAPSPVQTLLHQQGLLPAQLASHVAEMTGTTTVPLETDVQLSFADVTLTEHLDTYRILDAAANRAREGLRVLEDYVRFVLDDMHLTTLLKHWRHDLSQTLQRLPSHALLGSRDTVLDVGTAVKTRQEMVRESVLDVVQANFKRVEEATRTLEEFGKVLAGELGAELERLRYRLYTLEKAVLITSSARYRLAGRDLYLLVSEELCPHGTGPVLRQTLEAGVHIVQVREKRMSDRRLVEHGLRVREWTAKAGALFIMNDRPDLAVLTEADGVHVGQDELSVREVRRIVGPEKLIGVSTHSIEQARQAVLDGADYLGVGPVFATSTKQFNQLAGLEFVRQVAAEIQLPWYAIGGINAGNLASVVAAGARRVAVSSAICGAEHPAAMTRTLSAGLHAAAVTSP